jgi:hypothetical protein
MFWVQKKRFAKVTFPANNEYEKGIFKIEFISIKFILFNLMSENENI